MADDRVFSQAEVDALLRRRIARERRRLLEGVRRLLGDTEEDDEGK